MDISQIKHAYYINLEERPDRKDQVIQEFKKIGINNPERFNAIKCASGAVGCSMSHLKCLLNAKKQNWEHILIVEDDITFLNPQNPAGNSTLNTANKPSRIIIRKKG